MKLHLQWGLTMNGKPLASAEDIVAAIKREPISCQKSFLHSLQEQNLCLGLQKNIENEENAAEVWLWPSEWEKVQNTNRAYIYGDMLSSGNPNDIMNAHFSITGKVLHAAQQETNEPGPEVWFYSCIAATHYPEDQELFRSTRIGDTVLALDEPFKLSLSLLCLELELEVDKLDAPDGDGIMCVYGFKYQLHKEDNTDGIDLLSCGIFMVQYFTTSHHQNQLSICSAKMTPTVVAFGAQVARLQSGDLGEHAQSALQHWHGLLWAETQLP